MSMSALVSVASVVVATAAVYIAGAQFILATRKTKAELFDKRYTLFNTLWAYMSAHVTNHDLLPELSARVNNAQHQYLFLFSQDIFDYVEEARSHGVRFMVANQLLLSNKGAPEAMTKASQDVANAALWFSQQIPGLAQRFSPFLKLEEWSGVPDFVQNRFKTAPKLVLPKPDSHP